MYYAVIYGLVLILVFFTLARSPEIRNWGLSKDASIYDVAMVSLIWPAVLFVIALFWVFVQMDKVMDKVSSVLSRLVKSSVWKDAPMEGPEPTINTLNEYQVAAKRTANQDCTLAVLGLGTAGEAGEVADLIKKHLGHGHELDRTKLRKEIGDVLWYLAVLADKQGMSLQEVAQANVDKLSKRYPNGFSSEASINRADNDN